MLSTQEQMQFVVRFAGMDLDRLRPGDWLNLQDDFKRYLYNGYDRPGPETPRTALLLIPEDHAAPLDHPDSNLSEDEFRRLQQEVRGILQKVVAVRRMECPEGVPFTPFEITCALLPLDWMSDIAPTLRGRSRLCVRGRTRDVFLLSIFLLFTYEKTGKIGQCPACHALFLPVKKQTYCSKRCQMRVYMQQRRQQEHVKEREAEQAHARYASKRKRQLSEKVHVARRPRKGGKTR